MSHPASVSQTQPPVIVPVHCCGLTFSRCCNHDEKYHRGFVRDWGWVLASAHRGRCEFYTHIRNFMNHITATAWFVKCSKAFRRVWEFFFTSLPQEAVKWKFILNTLPIHSTHMFSDVMQVKIIGWHGERNMINFGKCKFCTCFNIVYFSATINSDDVSNFEIYEIICMLVGCKNMKKLCSLHCNITPTDTPVTFCAKPLSEPMLPYCQYDPWE